MSAKAQELARRSTTLRGSVTKVWFLQAAQERRTKSGQVSGRPRFGSVRLRFGGGTVRAVPVFGSGGSSAKKRLFCVSAQFNRKGWFRFLEKVPGKRFWRFRFLSVSGKAVPTVPVSGSGSVPEPP